MRLRNTGLSILLLLIIAGLALLSIYLLTPPSPVPATATASEFSAERAMQHVHEIAKEPHAMGTGKHAEVRKYLLQQMQRLDLKPQVQEATAVEQHSADVIAGYVYNLVGRLKGTGKSNQAILLMAHYDSQPNARGAADDGAGVAAILETIRALKQGKSLEHDIIVLLTDGEEYGLFGARAFMEHPWINDVALVLNVEARGNQGPSMTFEMSPQNGWVAKQYIKVAPYPFISSLAYEIYSRMPNNTDFTIFKDAGYTGLNSAFIDGFVHYHKLTDSPENLDRGSLQQHGSNMLALVRHFGTINLDSTKAPDTVFFNFINGFVISYPVEWSIFWILIAGLMLLATITMALRKNVITGWQTIVGVGMYLLLVVIIAGLFIPLNKLVLQQLPLTHNHNGVYSANSFFIAYLLLALGLFLLLSWLALRRLPVWALMLGVFILQFALVIVMHLFVPAASYLLLFPLLFCMSGALVALLLNLHNKQNYSFLKYVLIYLVAVLPAIFIVMPIVHVVFVAFALQLPVGSIALFVLLLGLLLPLLAFPGSQNYSFDPNGLLAVVLIVAGMGQLYRAIDSERPTPQQPLHSHVSYYLNGDSGKAYWVSNYAKTDDWNKQFFTEPHVGPFAEMYPDAQRIVVKNDAQPVTLPAPFAEVLIDSLSGDERIIRLRLVSLRGAAHMEIILQPGTADTLKQAFLNGKQLILKPVPAQTTPVYHMRYYGLPLAKDGILEVRLKKGTPLSLLLYDQSIGLPQSLIKQPMPVYVVPEQGRDSNLTVVRKSYSF